MSLVAGGNLTLNADSTLTFDPAGAFDLAPGDTFDIGVSYTVVDSAGNTADSAIAIEIRGNELPIIGADNLIVVEQGSVTVDLLANDTDPEGDPLTIVFIEGQPLAPGDTVGLPSGATVTMNLDGTVTYTTNPALDVASQTTEVDQFSYEIVDSAGNQVGAMVNVEIRPDEPPTVTDDNIAVSQSATITFDPLANDSDPKAAR